MTDPHRRTVAAATASSAAAASLMLAACSSSPTPATHTTRPTDRGRHHQRCHRLAHRHGTRRRKEGGHNITGHTQLSPHACLVITEQQATTALGQDPGIGTETSHLGASSCAYGTYRSRSIVTVNLVPVSGNADFDHFRAAVPTGQLVNVAGVGDAAFGVFQRPVASIWFTKDDKLVAIVVLNGTSTPPAGQATTLAKSAANRL